MQKFNPENHPDIQSNRRSEEVVVNEFLEVFQAHHGLFVSLYLLLTLLRPKISV